MGACTAQLTEVGSKRQDAPAQGSRFGIGPHSSLSGTLEDILRNGKAKVGKLVEGCHSVRSFPQDTLGLAKSVAGFFLETVSFVDSVFLIARNNLIFFVVGSDCQGFPFEVVSKELDDAFVGLDLDTSFANTPVPAIFVELFPAELHWTSTGVVDNDHSSFVCKFDGAHNVLDFRCDLLR